MMSDPDQHRVRPSQKVTLKTIDPDGQDYGLSREEAEQKFLKLQQELIELQEVLYAEGKQKLLVVFQAMDGGGKDGTIRSVFKGTNPQGVEVTAFKKPSDEELAHDYLWRIHKAVPAKGMIGIFNRSHYEDVLVVRVHRMVPEEVWRPRYRQINDFEDMLAASGTRIVKFFLHISKKEQKQRFEERLRIPEKRWKFDPADLEKRKLWDDYESAFEDMLNRCSTSCAPWYVVPADQNWYRDYVVASVIVDTLKDMKPKFPDPPDVTGVVIR
ncbi:MAG: polyphosphate kinase 2 family protein [Planctomycetota bacterium]